MSILTQILAVIALLSCVVLFAVLFWPRRVRCPVCRSAEIGEDRQPISVRTVDLQTARGGYTAVQTQFNVTRTCNQCRHQWTLTDTETT